MLVIAREINEDLIIDTGDEKILIKYVERRGKSQIRLGIEAPKHFKIYRREILEKIAKKTFQNG